MIPEDYRYFERLSERSLRDLEMCRHRGIPIAGIYCIYAPTELIRAAGMSPVGLCGKKEAPIAHAEKVLPSSLCPLIKSSYGYAASDTCPFFSFSDFVIGETTCDGKKKMYEFLAQLKPLYLMHLPYSQEESGARAFWRSEVVRFAAFLAERSGTAPAGERLAYQVELHNQMRREMNQVLALAADERSPLNSLQVMTILESKSFVVDLDAYVAHLSGLKAELAEIIHDSPMRPAGSTCRLLLTGCPVGKGCEKVLRLVEEAGASIVCMENCTGMKSILTEVEPRAELLDAVADRYLRLPCSCMTPNPIRVEAICRLAREFSVQGVIDMTWQFCHTYNVESTILEREIHRIFDLPFLHLETDYSPSDTEQLRTRIEAFLEIATKQEFH